MSNLSSIRFLKKTILLGSFICPIVAFATPENEAIRKKIMTAAEASCGDLRSLANIRWAESSILVTPELSVALFSYECLKDNKIRFGLVPLQIKSTGKGKDKKVFHEIGEITTTHTSPLPYRELKEDE